MIHFFSKINIIYNKTKIDIKHLTKHHLGFHCTYKEIPVADDYYQPDIFATHTQEHNMRQPRPNPTSQNNNFSSSKPS